MIWCPAAVIGSGVFNLGSMGLFKNNWSNWETLSLGTINAKIYLLQARKHKNGKIKFRVEVSSDAYYVKMAEVEENLKSKF